MKSSFRITSLRKRFTLFCFAMSVVAAVSTGTAGAATTSSEVEVISDIAYRTVDGITLRLNVYRSVNAPANAIPVLYIHGGGWANNDRNTGSDVSMMLAEHGYVAFSIDYRLTANCNDPADPLCAGVTAGPIVQDVRVAAKWIRNHADEYGARTDVLGAWGGSAGAHLAEILGSPYSTNDRLADAVVAYSGPAYLPLFTVGNTGYEQVLGLTGCELAVCPKTWKKWSPTHFVTAATAPMFIVNSEDEFIPVAGAEMLAGLLSLNAIPVDLRIVPGADHVPRSNELDAAGMAFLDLHLG